MVKNRYGMEEYIDQIEKFLRGQMSQEEERIFETALISDTSLRSDAFIVASMLREQKFR